MAMSAAVQEAEWLRQLQNDVLDVSPLMQGTQFPFYLLETSI